MQLNQTTDYAIRIVLYLAHKGGVISSKELSKNLIIPKNYISQITKHLLKVGLIETKQGIYGGFSLCRGPDEINMLDILTEMETTININRCLECDKYCNQFATEKCPVRDFYCQLQRNLEIELRQMTISKLLKNERRK